MKFEEHIAKPKFELHENPFLNPKILFPIFKVSSPNVMPNSSNELGFVCETCIKTLPSLRQHVQPRPLSTGLQGLGINPQFSIPQPQAQQSVLSCYISSYLS
ncbi:hypothetical protein RYX36_012450 [Vicia faba]